MTAKYALIKRLNEMFRFCYSEAEMDTVFKGLKIDWQNKMEEFGVSLGDAVEISFKESCYIGTIERLWEKDKAVTPKDTEGLSLYKLDPMLHFNVTQPNKFDRLVLNTPEKGMIIITLNDDVKIQRLE